MTHAGSSGMMAQLEIAWNALVKPRMFIASSVEHLDLAYAAQEGLEHDVEPTVWSQGVFAPSRTAMASLIDVLDESEFGLFILAPDDVTAIRNSSRQTVRDNVVFELGLFIGRIGAERCFLIVPRGVEDLHLPTDLLGITPATFDADRQDGNMVAALGPACNRVRKAILRLGALRRETAPNSTEVGPSRDDLVSDPNDCLSIIESWMGSRPASLNTNVMRFDEIDRDLKLRPGSAREYLATAARRWDYEVSREGKDTILLKEVERRYSDGW